MWRIESGLGSARSIDVRAMCELYRAKNELTRALIALAGETKAKGWWHAYGDAIPDWFELYVGLESAASHIRRYDEALILGLFQTRGYALAVYQHREEVTEDERERLVQVRLQRQFLLTRRLPVAPRLEAVISEATLLRIVGDRPTMAAQLRHLLDVGERDRVGIRVLPLSVGLHRGVEADTFVMLEFSLGNRATPDPPVVYSESWTGALYLDRPDEFAAYEKVWSSLDQLALDEGQPRNLINKIATEVHHG
ncbi:DUF5753 domain-containing protein [Micromonospora sp. NPDC049081]|uniref:DUF5753 domain-containing protein n=1 Tax=Micromonospora sp. NPDC049081 TaxID=3155150 RepID=UPI003411CC75